MWNASFCYFIEWYEMNKLGNKLCRHVMQQGRKWYLGKTEFSVDFETTGKTHN